MRRHVGLICFCSVLTASVVGGQFVVRLHAADGRDGANDKMPADYMSEAPLPNGFPPPSEVGEVVEKHYPASRSYSATGENAFFRCFTFLQKNKLEMTAPVLTDYRSPGTDSQGAEPDEEMELPVNVERMHFLLEKASLIEPGQEGAVTVADLPALHVLSIAHQGKLGPDDIARLEKRLKETLTAKAELKAAGPIRLMGYNGPQVPEEKRYWELQIPVESTKGTTAAEKIP